MEVSEAGRDLGEPKQKFMTHYMYTHVLLCATLPKAVQYVQSDT